MPCFYIADGHHRAASAARAARTCRAANPAHTGNEEYNYFLAVAFPSSQLRILPWRSRPASSASCRTTAR